MNATLARTAVCLVVAAGVQLAAQAPPAQAPTPSAEHKRLGYFVGRWTTEGEMKPSPMGPGGKVTATESCTWFQGNFAVVCNSEGKTPMGPSKSLGIMSYSAEEKVYTYYGVESSPMAMTTVPRGTVEGDTWTYTDEMQMGGQKIKSRVIIKEVSPTSYTFRMEIQGPDGNWTPMMESKSTKAAAKKPTTQQ